MAATGMDLLRVERIAKAQAWQRAGRAGRQAAGSCYRTYTLAEFEAMANSSVPEIQVLRHGSFLFSFRIWMSASDVGL